MADNKAIGIATHARLVSFIGHDGLTDFHLSVPVVNKDAMKRDVIILACYSMYYFVPQLKQENVNPLIGNNGISGARSLHHTRCHS